MCEEYQYLSDRGDLRQSSIEIGNGNQFRCLDARALGSAVVAARRIDAAVSDDASDRGNVRSCIEKIAHRRPAKIVPVQILNPCLRTSLPKNVVGCGR